MRKNVGKIVNTFGLKGELKVLFNQDVKLNIFYISGYNEEFECEKQVVTKKFVKIKIHGFDDINQVVPFVGRNIELSQEESEKLEDDEYLVSDLIGSKIFYKQNEIGVVTNVENFGASDILVFESDGKEMRVPLVADFFELVDLKNKTINASDKFFEGTV